MAIRIWIWYLREPAWAINQKELMFYSRFNSIALMQFCDRELA